nr:MAG TPA: hypothetical protein [Caudoviricetes sp.]
MQKSIFLWRGQNVSLPFLFWKEEKRKNGQRTQLEIDN